MMIDDSIPQWLAPYAHAEKAGWSQNHMAYAEYYGVDGSADDGECEERIALDNGAWSAFVQQQPFDEDAFLLAVDRFGEGADWIVLPDSVAGGLASLEFSLRWKERLRGMPTKMLLAVQNGMQINDVASLLSPAIGIFIGGTTEWKEATAQAWGSVARRRHCHLHVGRVNSARRIRICAAAGADSFDGSGVSRYA